MPSRSWTARPGRRLRSFAVATLLLSLAFPGGAAADAYLVTASPPDGATLESAPDAVVLTFSESLQDPSTVVVQDAGGANVASGGRDDTNLAEVVAELPDNLAPGTYEIRWTATGRDGHIIRDTLTFTLLGDDPDPTPPPGSGGDAEVGILDVALPIGLLGVILLGLYLGLFRRREPSTSDSESET